MKIHIDTYDIKTRRHMMSMIKIVKNITFILIFSFFFELPYNERFGINECVRELEVYRITFSPDCLRASI